jgi:hypothetical protein
LSHDRLNPGRRERDALVRANGLRQTIFAEQTVEDRPHAESPGRAQPLTRQQVSGVLVGHGERVTVHAITGPKVALEVRGPEIIGRGGCDRHDAGMRVVATPSAFLDQPRACEEVPCRADRRQSDRGVPRAEPVQELLRPPARMLPTGLADQPRHLVGDLVRTPPRRPAPVAESFTASPIESVQPLVTGLPTDTVPRTQIGHRVQGQPVVAHEALALFHGCSLQPGHRSTSQSMPSVLGVTHVPGLFCYQCTRFVPERSLTSACSRRRSATS